MREATTTLLAADLALAERVLGGDPGLDAQRRACQEHACSLLRCRRRSPATCGWSWPSCTGAEKIERMGDLAAHVADTARFAHSDHAVSTELEILFTELGAVTCGMADRVTELITAPAEGCFAELERTDQTVDALHTWARLGEVVATETSDEAVAVMVSTWLRLRDGAPDPHTLTAGLLMLAATNEQVARINDATQAVRQARGELGDGATYRLPGGREPRFHVGDLVLIRSNDRHQQAVTGDTVLNGYRGVVTRLTPEGVEVAWVAEAQ